MAEISRWNQTDSFWDSSCI